MANESSLLPGSLRGLDGTRRFALAGVLVALLVGVGLVGRWASTPTYVMLFSNLDLKESGAIADRLQKANIPHRLQSGGGAIEVPSADIARARVALAKDGLPTQGRPGLELFDKPSWGMTDFTQRVTYQRALEGELARTIGQIDGIERAEVHLLMPETDGLRRKGRQAGASVVLTLKGGTPPASETVQGIAFIVANSVEGLSADQVAIMDGTGRVLSLPASGLGGVGLTNRQQEVARGLEGRTVGKIEGLVGTVVGVGRVRAQVAAELSFDQVDATTETFDPDRQVLQQEQRSEGGPADGSGPQTVVSNQYQNSRRVEKSTSLAGRLQRMTIAVLVDEKALRAGEKDRQLTDIAAMVRDAVGVDSTRGDRLSVLAVPFEPVTAADAGPAKPPALDPVAVVERVSHPLIGVVAILVMVFLAFQVKGVLAPARAPARVAGPGAPSSASATAPDDAAGALPAPPENAELNRLKNRLQQDSGDRPEVTAQVLKAWLAEEKARA
jgi:flagellar M-ring protein FliF